MLSLVSLGFVVPVIRDYIQTGLAERFPTLIVCCFVFLTAIISFFAGMLLQTLSIKDRQEFEMWLHKAADRKKELMEHRI